jgi:hypothetical protein
MAGRIDQVHLRAANVVLGRGDDEYTIRATSSNALHLMNADFIVALKPQMN